MLRGRWIALMVVAALGAVTLSACGDSGESSAASAEAGFVEQANAICEEGKKRAAEDMEGFLQPVPESEWNKPTVKLEAIRASYIPSLGVQIQEIGALKPPKGEEEQVKAFLVALDEAIYSESRDLPRPFFKLAFEHSARLARELGIRSCIYESY